MNELALLTTLGMMTVVPAAVAGATAIGLRTLNTVVERMERAGVSENA